MKRIVLVLSLIFLFCCSFFPVPLLYASAPGGNKFQVELFGGFSMLNPWDLNQQTLYDMAYEEFYHEWQYRHYHSLLGDNFTYTVQAEGVFKKIKNALPLGFRIRYFLTPSLSISMGFTYLSKKQNSRVTYRYDVRSLNPDDVFYYNEFSSTSENSPYSLFVKGYVLPSGIFYKIKGNRFLDFEAYLTAGPIFAECGFARQHNYRESNSYGYWYEENVFYEIKGKGVGVALDTGIRMNIHVLKKLNLFVECGYSLRSAVKISGPGSRETVYNDANSSGYTDSADWEGTWFVLRRELNRPWGGPMIANFLSNEYGGGEYPNFKLDLSGLQVKIGISFEL
ncbi:MAG: hypothetical protein JSV88_00905 [Candidatus Aminicenantes bacterium]|nr:MAG: hypothetical protein JSV88_00905 [Candidatus Aminicenantes bacterium]